MTRERAEQLAASDIADSEINTAIGRVSTLTADIGKLSGIYGGSYGQAEAEQEVFFADETARRRRRDLASREAAEFSGGSAIGKGSLAVSQSY